MSTSGSTRSNAAARRSRVSGLQWMSPAAATRIGLAIARIQAQRFTPAPLGTREPVPSEETPFDVLLETLKKVAGLLRDADIPFLLGGGLAVWARGGPETVHDST